MVVLFAAGWLAAAAMTSGPTAATLLNGAKESLEHAITLEQKVLNQHYKRGDRVGYSINSLELAERQLKEAHAPGALIKEIARAAHVDELFFSEHIPRSVHNHEAWRREHIDHALGLKEKALVAVEDLIADATESTGTSGASTSSSTATSTGSTTSTTTTATSTTSTTTTTPTTTGSGPPCSGTASYGADEMHVVLSGSCTDGSTTFAALNIQGPLSSSAMVTGISGDSRCSASYGTATCTFSPSIASFGPLTITFDQSVTGIYVGYQAAGSGFFKTLPLTGP